MATPKLSIIIPIYNAEKYLRRCLDSVLNQTFTDWECLLIDDGSKDSSGTICDEYAKMDSRFLVFHKENGGVSTARNLGLDNANGEWITFSDSDDWLENKAFEEYVNNILESCADYFLYSHYINDNPKLKQPLSDTTPQECLMYNECDKLWEGVYKKSIIKANNIRFDTSLSLAEDKLFNMQYLLYCNRVIISEKAFYHYNFGNKDCLSFNGFKLESWIKMVIEVYNIKRKIGFKNTIGYRYMDKEFINSFKQCVWYSIIDNRSINEIIRIREVFLNSIYEAPRSMLFNSKEIFFLYVVYQKYKFYLYEEMKRN